MLHLDYAKIIIIGLCDSPKFLAGHLKRVINKLIEEGYEFDEVEYNLNFILSLVKKQIKEIHERDLKKFDEYKKLDSKLPNSKKYFYPQPKPVNEISIPEIHFPNRTKLDLSRLTRTFTIKDFSEVEDALKEISNYFKERTTIETTEEQETHKEVEVFLSEFKNEFNTTGDYLKAVSIIQNYFLGDKTKISKPIFIRNNNIKKLAFALGEIWRSKKNDSITYEYLVLCKKTFSIFESQKVDKKNLFGCNLYKYSISKT